jgi:alkylation response protein AidB-like acyl-CoA dehydrogenase
LADITAAAGKSPAVFCRYFDDKEDLLADLAESFLHNFLSGIVVYPPESPHDTQYFTSVVMLTGARSMAFGLTEPGHGSDATWLETRAVADGDSWVINGTKRWHTGVHRATHDLVFARTSGEPGQATGITAFLVQTDAQMVRLLVYYAAWHLDRDHHMEVSDKVSMANYRANRLVCAAAHRAMQVHGGFGYSRHEPFEHIYRHHRHRITEGAEEIQIRRVAQRMFKFGSRATQK